VFFAQGISPHQNGDELFGEEKFHAANVKAQACSQSALLFFPFKVEVGGRIFFHFPLVPNVFPLYVPFKLSMGSQYVPQVPRVFPNMFPIAPHFYHICFDVVLISPI